VIIRIHIYTGGMSSYPTFSFNSALQHVISLKRDKINIVYQTMNVLQLRESNWTEKDFIDWLLNCDIHMIIAHPYQGTETFNWNISNLYKGIERLFTYRFPDRRSTYVFHVHAK
jgi:hypothetical protein